MPELCREESELNLEFLGWNSFFADNFKPYALSGYCAARIAAEHKGQYYLYSDKGSLAGKASGKMRFNASSRSDYPAVGDWVVVSYPEEDSAVIHAVLPRQSKFSRKLAGKTTEEQIIVANVNTVLLVTSLNSDFNLRRLERYLTLAWEAGASPVIVLSKADLCDNISQKLAEVEPVAFGTPVHVISVLNNLGFDELAAYFTTGNTIAVLGSSGVGKSSLINKLIGQDVQVVNGIREADDRGRHTTTHRELIILPAGGLIVDTPGMRELQLWGSEAGLKGSFEDVESYAEQCFFKDCQHQSEPNCAVQRAMTEGKLEPERFDSYLKLQKELAYLARQQNQLEYLADKAKWKKLNKAQKSSKKR